MGNVSSEEHQRPDSSAESPEEGHQARREGSQFGTAVPQVRLQHGIPVNHFRRRPATESQDTHYLFRSDSP